MPELKARRLGIVGSCGFERELEDNRDPATVVETSAAFISRWMILGSRVRERQSTSCRNIVGLWGGKMGSTDARRMV